MTFSFPLIFHSKSLLQETMYNPKTQFSDTYTHQNLNFRNPGTTNFVCPDSKLPQNYESTHNNQYNQKTLQFRHNHSQQAMESDNSGVNSPKSPSHPLLGHRSPSPNPRAQAIARGQWELMEMVKNMPASSYELSLKDLVEHHRIENDHQDGSSLEQDQILHQRDVVKLKKQEQSKKINDHRNVRSYENKGVFLNMVFPFSLKSNRKKGKFGSNSSGKVSRKPESERDWWKKRFVGSTDSDSSRTSHNSGGGSNSSTAGSSGGGGSRCSGATGGGGGGRKRNGLLTGCWPFMHSRRSKSV